MSPSAVEAGLADGPSVALQTETQSNGASSQPTRSNPEHEEYQYLDLIRDILDYGEHRPDRTGTGTYSLFAPHTQRYTLSRPRPSTSSSTQEYDLILPLLTTKRVFLRAVIAELLWFIAGCTSTKPLQDQGVRIWDGNGSREFLDKVGLGHRAEGDLGPIYGFQWRHFGAAYKDANADYAGQGVDQLREILHKLKHNPHDRRIILSAWNPAALKDMALPPCHVFAQFYVSYPSKARRTAAARPSSNGANSAALHPPTAPAASETEQGVLHTHLYQRSADTGLGLPFNIASYALLTHMLAHAAGLRPGSLTHALGDAHVYLDHVEALEGQLAREPRLFPTLEILRPPPPAEESEGADLAIDGWKVEDFKIVGYEPHKGVAMKMSV